MSKSGNALDLATATQQGLPEEFCRFRETIMQRPGDSTLDGKVEEWAYILDAWRKHLAESTYRRHALKLLLPILDTYGGICFQRYQEKGLQPDLELALELYQEAVQETPDEGIDLLRRLEGLGLVQGIRYNQTKSQEDLDQILQTLEQAMELVVETPAYAQYLYFIGEYYKERYRITKDLSDLTKTISCLQESAQREPTRRKVDALYLLGFMYRERYVYSENNTDLKLAIDVWHEALSFMKLYEPEVSGLLENIGATFAQYYELAQTHADLEEAIPFWKDITSQLSSHAPVLATCFTFLSYCCFMQYVYTDKIEDLDQAIEASIRAVELSLPYSEERVRSLNNLGNTLKTRYGACGDTTDLEKAEKYFEEAKNLALDVSIN